MEEKKVKYAIGDQDFKSLREGECLYVDKTQYIDLIINSGTKYYFLARPRRFGKSLFLSTLRYFYEGRRELFKGLYIDSVDWDWEAYPVLRLDLNSDKYEEMGRLDDVLNTLFVRWEAKYEVPEIAQTCSQRFKNIITSAHEKTGRPVVILVDEYDKPLVGNLRKSMYFEHYRAKLASVYSNFKSSAEHIKLVFMTGISRFSKLSVFSDLNNLKDISFSDDFADICGITERELLENFQQGIKQLAESYRINHETVCRRLKQSYDGYRFAKNGSDIYNPWSVLNAMDESRIGGYWNATGTASIVAEALHASDVDLEKTLNARWKLDRLAGLDLRNVDPTALLYQAGYLTIGDYNFRNDTVRLKVPNKEVREGLFNDLLQFYVKVKRGTAEGVVSDLVEHLESGRPEEMLKSLRAYFAGIPYDLKMDNENNFHNAFYILVTLIGLDAKAEVHTSDGRIDLLIETPDYVYVIELKYDASAEDALHQIEEKEYALRFEADGRKVFKIGVSFSSETRRIEDWKIQ
ncbi:MAG: ATP-binding protein [Muribaculaceae bacterium]|nr:ATP-binding protein [Muribaculaceae bacterium]